MVIETNIDDMSPELLGYTSERLFTLGALDVFMSPIYMKKQRPGTLLSVIARPEDKAALVECLLTETTTFGVRFLEMERAKLKRSFSPVMTEYGEVRVKRGGYRGEQVKVAPEYEDCAELARRHGVPLRAVFEAAQRAASDEQTANDA